MKSNISIESIQAIGNAQRESGQSENEAKARRKPRQHSAWSYISNRVMDMVQQAFKKKRKMDEFEQLLNEMNAARNAQQRELKLGRGKKELESLTSKTRFTRQELKLLYWGWKCSCPSGILNEQQFKEIYAQFFPQGDSSLYATLCFKAMFGDRIKNYDGLVTFADYAQGLSTLWRGEPMEKIHWIFSLYDINGDGKITMDEVVQVVTAIYALLGIHVAPAYDEKTFEIAAKRVFSKLDPEEKGFVTLEQFEDICAKDETILNAMQLLDTQTIDIAN